MKKPVKLIVQYLILLAVVLLGAFLYQQAEAYAQRHYEGILTLLAMRTVLRIAGFLLILFRTRDCILRPERACVPVYAVCAVIAIGLLIVQYVTMKFYPQFSVGLLLLAAVSEIFNAVTAGRSQKPEA